MRICAIPWLWPGNPRLRVIWLWSGVAEYARTNGTPVRRPAAPAHGSACGGRCGHAGVRAVFAFPSQVGAAPLGSWMCSAINNRRFSDVAQLAVTDLGSLQPWRAFDRSSLPLGSPSRYRSRRRRCRTRSAGVTCSPGAGRGRARPIRVRAGGADPAGCPQPAETARAAAGADPGAHPRARRADRGLDGTTGQGAVAADAGRLRRGRAAAQIADLRPAWTSL